jgi:hypothetical protein
MPEAGWAPEARESTCTGLANGNGVEDEKESVCRNYTKRWHLYEKLKKELCATIDTVCFSKRLTDKSFILYCQIRQENFSNDSNILHASGV